MDEVNKVEAILFASGKAMEEEHIKELAGLKPKQTKDALEGLKKRYEEADSSLFIFNDATRWKINVKEHYIDLVRSLVAETELEKPVLETLAIIAYRQPILQSDVVKARGERAYEHIHELVERGFATKEKYGRSFKLKLTDKFYNYFDVEGDKDIREVFKDINVPEPQLPKGQKKLGGLDVVEAQSDEEAAAEEEVRRKENELEIYEIKKQREEDKKNYLNDFENRLGEVTGRISETEKDILKAKQQQSEEKDSEEGEETVKAEEEETTKDTEEETIKNEEEPEEDDPEAIVASVEKEIEELTGKKEE